MIEKISDTKEVEALFEGWEETMIWSCMQGVMGEVYASSRDNPVSVMAILGDFTFFAGVPDKELILYKPDWCTQDFMIMVPQNAAWAELIEQCYKGRAKKRFRYAIRKEPGIFDREKLRSAVDALPKEYSIQLMDEALYEKSKSITWCSDWVAQYADYEIYGN